MLPGYIPTFVCDLGPLVGLFLATSQPKSHFQPPSREDFILENIPDYWAIVGSRYPACLPFLQGTGVLFYPKSLDK